ncbi:uncharacterized protein EV422DRAFT_497813 [Fimicolochytrium jonesii]|uniref:uncharacterized protein n=1 Tax=Fimicolochytrium jonesii TaxID=1396493 RepID=UPI0022FE3633|nr:uncharacterized protein EV422DRAFT_497813 [Fimicolochytrium jonesii]KAI8819344.1 hypothetical protein EV422DRAFT_497813 [Fimicolochytrium jonesii]
MPAGQEKVGGIPKGWPTTVEYLRQNRWARGVPASVKAHYLPSGWPLQKAANPFDPVTPARFIMSASHPAHGQNGLFASAKLEPRQHVCDYIGELHAADTASTTSDYILSFDRYTGLSVDAEKAGGVGRFINDFRGVATRPNVEFETYRDAKTGEVRMGVWVLGKSIKKGEELCISYGKGWWLDRGLI